MKAVRYRWIAILVLAACATGPAENPNAVDTIDVQPAQHTLLLGVDDIVLLNAGAALLVAGKAERLQDGIRLAAEVIDNGHARHVLDRLVEITNQVAAA